MELGFELLHRKAIEENDLKIAELPEDARTGIAQINSSLNSLAVNEKRGKKATPTLLKRLKAMDKWTYYEILDYLHDTDNNEEKPPVDMTQLQEEIKEEGKQGNAKKDDPKQDKGDPKQVQNNNEQVEVSEQDAIVIEKELKALFETGKPTHTALELKSSCPKSYSIIFKTYDSSGDNGIQTSTYSLIETEEQVFTITKN